MKNPGIYARALHYVLWDRGLRFRRPTVKHPSQGPQGLALCSDLENSSEPRLSRSRERDRESERVGCCRSVKVFTTKTEGSWTAGGGGETKAEGKQIICEPWIMPDLNLISQQHIEAEVRSCIQLAKPLASIWERGKKVAISRQKIPLTVMISYRE